MDCFMPQNPFANIPRHGTDEELASLKAMSDDDLLRSACSLDLFAGVEASRRLREGVQKEERATNRLTGVSVFLTIILVILTLILVWLGLRNHEPIVSDF
jgi:hypothetical protein